MIEPGDTAPTFSLPATNPESDDVGDFDLTTAIADGPVVVNFYVFDFHPACTRNLCDLHDLEWFDIDTDVTAVGVSSDGVFSHAAFATQEKVGIPLLADSGGTVADAYGVQQAVNGHDRRAMRSVFVVDTDGTVQFRWVADAPTDQPDWSAVKAAVDEFKTEA
ncbi:redoxin domain-containing protein [Halobacteriales archaeon Cl-PHB]